MVAAARISDDGGMRMERPLKVLITTDWYEPVVNGVVASVLTLKKQLELLGCDVRVLTLSGSVRSTIENGVYRLGSVSASLFYDHARLAVRSNRRIRRELEQWRPDVIHSQCEFSTHLWAKRLAKSLRIPVVHTYHTIYEDYTHYYSPSRTMGKKMVSSFSRKVCTAMDAVIVPTGKVADLLQGYGITTPISVIPTGLDLTHFRPAATIAEREQSVRLRAELGIPAHHRVLISVCRLAKEKNVDEVIASFAASGAENTTLVLVGDGPYRPELERLVERLDVQESVRFAGFVAPSAVPEYYRMADVFVSASLSETQGLTYIEAQACGLPLLCREDPSLEQVVVPGRTGWTFTSADGFRRGLDAITSSSAVMRAMGDEGASHAAAVFSARAFGLAVLGVYRRVLGLPSVEQIAEEMLLTDLMTGRELELQPA